MAKKENGVATTQRAYTLRLRGLPGDKTWRDALWATHEAVNRGAKVFGDWLLTLRGGLSHALADAKVKEKKKPDRDPTPAERRDRRILLALSWLSVEDEYGAPTGTARVASGGDSPDKRTRALIDTLCGILEKRGVLACDIGDPSKKPEDQPATWIADCAPSLKANLRDDAVWVNRSLVFDSVADGVERAEARKDAQTLLWFILKDDYLFLPVLKKADKKDAAGEEEGAEEAEGKERRQAVQQSSKGAARRTRHPYGHLLGEGKPFGKPKRSLSCREHWAKHLKELLIEKCGIPLREVSKKSDKVGANDAGQSQTELHREMFSKAASRLAQIWTKQRQQEVERQSRQSADEELKKMEADAAFSGALDALREYCVEYRDATGALGEFRIRPGQITGWDRVVMKWASIDESDSEEAQRSREQAAKDLQDADPDKKFGDVNLFIRLAAEDYRSVWWHAGKPGAADASAPPRLSRSTDTAAWPPGQGPTSSRRPPGFQDRRTDSPVRSIAPYVVSAPPPRPAPSPAPPHRCSSVPIGGKSRLDPPIAAHRWRLPRPGLLFFFCVLADIDRVRMQPALQDLSAPPRLSRSGDTHLCVSVSLW